MDNSKIVGIEDSTVELRDKIIYGNSLVVLKKLPDNFANCCITSPPYWGLRNYETNPQIWDGEENCEHEWVEKKAYLLHENRNNLESATQEEAMASGKPLVHIHKYSNLKQGFCKKCGAWLGELGLEPTPELYIKHLTDIFREVRRVLRNDGTLWLNLGDSYAGSGKGGQSETMRSDGWQPIYDNKGVVPIGLKPKDLVGIPWRAALALQADGWYLRSDIIWSKPNNLPESVKDRPTKSHEYIFLLSKSPKYYYDYKAILEPANYDGRKDTIFKGSIKYKPGDASPRPGSDRWSHKITGRTGDGHSGYLDKDGKYRGYKIKDGDNHAPQHHGNDITATFKDGDIPARNKRSVWTIPTKPFPGAHFAVFSPDLIVPCILAGCPKGGLVLDPFFGSGTTGEVANRLGRYFCGIELNENYIEIAKRRTQKLDIFLHNNTKYQTKTMR